MREILFRGKCADTGEWVEGSYVHRTQFYGEDCPCDDHFILSGGEFHCDYYNAQEIIPETLGQFTGLTDINGKRIFEGDICLCDRNINDHIDKETFIIKFSSLNGWYGESKDGWSEFNGSDFECAEVIGNIHDDAEAEK